MKHHLERTSPRSQPFLGTCRLCGLENLPMSAVQEDCENVRGLTPKEALAEVLAARSASAEALARVEAERKRLSRKVNRTERREQVVHLRKQGLTLREIADNIGVTPSRISQILAEADLMALTQEHGVSFACVALALLLCACDPSEPPPRPDGENEAGSINCTLDVRNCQPGQKR